MPACGGGHATGLEGFVRWQFIMLVVWALVVACVVFLAAGFANSPGEIFTADNWLLWMMIGSVAIPLALWLREQLRAGS
jgi:hypothetical protein